MVGMNNHEASKPSLSRSNEEICQALETLRPDLLRHALKLTANRSRAEDVVHDTAVRALRFSHRYQPGTNVKAWLNQILRSVFLTERRKASRQRRAYEGAGHSPSRWIATEKPIMLPGLSAGPARAMAKLPEHYRQAVELVDMGELTYREAATRLGVPLGTLMSRLHRARKRLASELSVAPMAA